MLSPTSRLAVCFLLVILISSCNTSSPTEATPTAMYPTYDPFAPVGGPGTQVAPISVGQVSPPTRPAGPTPTRAPISVTLPPRDPNSSNTTPTPDSPHPLPPQRDYLDQYTVQAGDTLVSISQSYGITLEALMQANGLDETSLLIVGMVLNIPPIEADPNPGSSFKLIPDSELVYGPSSAQFDISAFIQGHGGYLASYTQDVEGEYLTGEQIITRAAQNYSVNPRLLLAMLEYRSGWVTNPTPQNVDYPLGIYEDYYAGLSKQINWAANNLNRGYYYWRVNAISTLPLSDGTYVPLDPTINAGTAGVQYFLSLFNNRSFWDYDVSALGFFQTYNQLFGYPFDFDVVLVPVNLSQPPMQLPIEPGTTWSYTGGPHGGWDTGSGWAALDFAPPGEALGCVSSDAWIVAVANGWIVRAENGAVVQDLDNDGYEQTGWNVLYMHIETRDRIQPNTYVYAGERIGHPSCEGGFSNGTHVHLARKYNGEWISADGNIPFTLDGWISSGNGYEYDGYLTRGSITLEALEGRFEGLNQISR
ncbi:MAG TPA: LysM peptidoglycan-binding domain-containing protein [Anaerolineales bacterium]|nr:LysM peptidoglycan-binding domain-containing protein [Anaerolineales bacterium]